MNTYTETVNRYRIVRHEELPEEHKQCYRDAGINPDDNWQLIWSFEDEEFAAEKLQEIQKHAPYTGHTNWSMAAKQQRLNARLGRASPASQPRTGNPVGA